MKDSAQVKVLAENLRYWMRRLACSQELLEAESGVPQATISRILNAKSNPAVTQVWRLAKALGISLELLLPVPQQEKGKKQPISS